MRCFSNIATMVVAAALLISCGAVRDPKYLTGLSITEAVQLIRSGRVSSVALTTAYLDQAEQKKT